VQLLRGRLSGAGAVAAAFMLRTCLIVSASGLVLFCRQFGDGLQQPRLVGSLLRALIEFAVQTTSLPVSYIELTNGAASSCHNIVVII
jgi:hypothetical protein